MISTILVDEITNKYNNIAKYNLDTYETKIRMNTINNSLNTIIDMLDDLELELNRDRDYVSTTVKNMIIENDKKNQIIDKFLPLMTLYSIINNENSIINNENSNNNTYLKNTSIL